MMDASYTKTADITSLPDPKTGINAHEFTVFDGGRSALVMYYHGTVINSTDVDGGIDQIDYLDTCIMEIDIATRQAEFDWCPLQNGVSPQESFAHEPEIEPLIDYL